MTTALEIIETGEVITEMTEEEASSITTRISVKLDTVADNLESAMPLIREALTRRAFAALGYASAGAYIADRFGNALSRLGADMRREVVRELTQAGLSTRAIAPVVGVSQRQVVTDRSAGEKSLLTSPSAPAEAGRAGLDEVAAPEPDPLDQKIADELARSEGRRIDPEPSTEVTLPEPEPVAATVTGTDGKTYPASSKPVRRRSSIADAAEKAGWDIRKAMERIERVFDDDRYRANDVRVATLLRGHLMYVAETAAAVLAQLPTSEPT